MENIFRVPLAMRTTAASRARAAAIAQSKSQTAQRTVLTKRGISGADRPPKQEDQLSNNANNNQQLLENDNDRVNAQDNGTSLHRSGTYEKINELNLLEDRNHNEQSSSFMNSLQAEHSVDFWAGIQQFPGDVKQQSSRIKNGYLKNTSMLNGRRVGDSSMPVAAPRSLSNLKHSSDTVTKRSQGSALASPFNYRPPKSSPTTPNSSKIPTVRMERSVTDDPEHSSNSTTDGDGFILATAKLVTTV